MVLFKKKGDKGTNSDSPHAKVHEPSELEKKLAIIGPPRTDGSDKFFGLENIGNSCFANSILQCLFYSVDFREQILQYPFRSPVDAIQHAIANAPPRPLPELEPKKLQAQMAASARSAGVPANSQDDKTNTEIRKRQLLEQGPLLTMTYDNSRSYQMDENMFTLLKDLFEGMASSTSQRGVVRPIRFLETMRKNAYGFRDPIHHDAHEFLIFLLNELTTELEANVKKQEKQAALTNGNGNGSAPNDSLIHSALTNGNANAMLPADVSRMIHDLFEGLISSETRCLTCETTSKREEVFLDLSVDLGEYNSVTSCLRQFSQEEMLYERNKFHCDNCGGLQEAEKRIRVKNLPKILVLQLKRFQFRYVPNIHYKKVFYRVVYPLYLRMFNTADEAEDQDRLYELYAIVIHIGSSLQHGHYVSVVKTPELGWLLLDDELVEPVSSSFVQHFFGGEPRVDRRDQTMASAYVLFYRQTTFEQMQKDMDKEGVRPTAGEAAAKEEALKDTHGLNLFEKHPATEPDHLQRTATSIPVPVPSYEAKYDNLDHFPTAPETPMTPGSPGQTKTSFFSPKSSTAKKEEKERKAAEKAAEKERKKADEQRRKDHFKTIAEQQKQQDAEMKAALAASKLTKAEEDQKAASASKAMPIPNRKTNGIATSNGSPPVSAGSPQAKGFSRFRKGSKSVHLSSVLPINSVSSNWSLRDKEKADAAKVNASSQNVPPVPATPEIGNSPVLPTTSNGTESTTTDQTQSQQGAPSTNTDATTASEAGDTVPATISTPKLGKSSTFFGGNGHANGNGKSEEPLVSKKSKFGSLRKRTASMSFLNSKDKSGK